MQNGLWDLEISTIDEFVSIAEADPKALQAVLDLSWVQDKIQPAEFESIKDYRWLAQQDAEALQTALQIPWVQDGVSELESSTITQFARLADHDVQALRTVLQLPWVQDGIEEIEADSIERLRYISTDNVETAKTTLELGWVQDGIEDLEFTALHELHYINLNDSRNAALVLALPWVQDGIDDEAEAKTITEFAWLRFYDDSDITASIIGMPWVQDGIEEIEADSIERLRYISTDNVETAKTTLELGWVQDGIEDLEFTALHELRYINLNDSRNAALVLALPWVQDGIDDEAEAKTITEFAWLRFYDDSDITASIIGMPWVQDGIEEIEADSIERLRYISTDNVETAKTTLELGWVQDGIEDLEFIALHELRYINLNDSRNAALVLALPWVQDGIDDEAEAKTITEFAWLRFYDDSDITASIIGMPFLASIETADTLALRATNTLGSDEKLQVLTSHPMFQTGITDDETPLIAGLGTLVGKKWRDPLKDKQKDTDGEIKRVLDRGVAQVETLSAATDLTPNMTVSIVWTDRDPVPGIIEDLLYLIEFTENTIELPLPVDHIIVMLNQAAILEGAGGANHGYAFTFYPESVSDDGYRGGFVHELTHYYSWGESWMHEGMANFAAYRFGLSVGKSEGQSRPTRGECEVHDIEMLSELSPDFFEDYDDFLCNYYLGELLFRDLFRNMGAEAFTASLHELLQLSEKATDEHRTAGIEEIRTAFAGQEHIIEYHWSGKLNAPENRPYDDGWRAHHLVEWTNPPTYENGYVSFQARLLQEAIFAPQKGPCMNLALNNNQANEDGIHFAGWIFQSTGWVIGPTDVLATSCVLDTASRSLTVRFPFSKALEGVPSDYHITLWGFQNADMIPTIYSGGSDPLGYARIRVR